MHLRIWIEVKIKVLFFMMGGGKQFFDLLHRLAKQFDCQKNANFNIVAYSKL